MDKEIGLKEEREGGRDKEAGGETKRKAKKWD